MRVGIDAQLARGTATGIGEYVTGLLAALRELPGIEPVALEAPWLDPWRFDRRVLWDQALLPLAARRAGVELLHCAGGTLPLVAPLPLLATVHDVAFLRVQAHVRPYARAYFGAFQLARYRRARGIVVDSEFSRAELLACGGVAPERVTVVYPGVSPDLFAIERRPAERPYVLVVGTVEPRKDLGTAIRALAGAPELRLVSAGPFTPYRDECERIAREAGVEARVELRGYVPRAELLALYASATFVAMPSRYEGFGYGAAQALCAGVPLLSSDAASLPEVVGDAAPLLPPGDVERWSAGFREMLAARDASEARAAAARPAAIARFAWATSARSVAAAYARVLAGN